MCRLSTATDRRAFRLLVAALSVVPLAILLALAPLPARADPTLPRLHQVLLQAAEHPPDVRAALPPRFDQQKTYENLTILAIPLPVFHLTFAEGESFRFILPISILYDSGGFGSRGSTQYAYTLTYADGSTVESTIPVPNKLLRIRSALLAAEDYWNEAAGRSGHSFELVAPGEPIDVNIGYFVYAASIRAFANFFRQEIRLRHDLHDEELETTPIHELFHILTHAIIQTRFRDAEINRLWALVGLLDNLGLPNLLFESTATWSEDEPISVPAGAGGIPGRNIDTDYASDCPPPYDQIGTDLFERNPYCVSWLVKYYVEQIAGGSDTPMPEVVLDLIARVASRRFTMDNFFQALAEGLPADRFTGATWQERWRRFYTSFAAAVLVRRPSVAGGVGSQLAFHDDAFADITGSTFFPMSSHRRDYLRAPERIYETPAADDAERSERLATIARSARLAPFAYIYNVLELNVLKDVYETQGLDDPVPRPVEARPVFVYARGPEGTNAFLLRQNVPDYWDWEHRNFGSFERIDDFSLIGSDGTVVSEQGEIPASGGDNTYINLGLVNSGPDSASREISWAYLASPRIIPTPTRSRLFDFQHITPVRLVNGSAYSAYAAERRHLFQNGDSFVFEVAVTGKLHLGADSRENIPEDERTIQLAIVCGGDDRPVLLAEEDGQTIEVAASPSPRDGPDGRYFYLLSGRVDPDNTVTGDCRVRVELTSLLNLGGGDRQVDESYTLRVGDPVPEVSRLQVISGGEVVYDSQDMTRFGVRPVGGTVFELPEGVTLPMPRLGDGAYTLRLKVWFSTPVPTGHASITAGFAPPYDTYEVPVDPEFSDVPTWSTWADPDDPTIAGGKALLETELTIPEMAAPLGGLLWFSISAISETDVVLDTDPATPGDQRDTRHFALLNMDDYYLATLSVESRWDGAYAGADYQATWDVVYRPFEAQFRALPVSEARHANSLSGIISGALAAPELLISWQRLMTWIGAAAGDAKQAALADLDAEFRVLIRLLEGAGSYGGCFFDDFGPVPARFGGMDSTYTWRGWSANGGSSSTVEHAATAPAWQSNDSQSLGWDYLAYENLVCPAIEVWNYDPADLARAQEFIANPPIERLGADFAGDLLLLVPATTFIRGNDRGALPAGLTHLWFDVPDDVARSGFIEELPARQAFARVFDDALALVTIVAWRFALTDDDGKVARIESSGNVMFDDGTLSLPALPEGPLIRVIFEPADVWPIPVDGRYRQIRRFWDSDGLTEYIDEGEFDGSSLWQDVQSVPVAEPPVMPAHSLEAIAGFEWTLEQGTQMQVTNRTFPQHLLGDESVLVITGRLEDGRLAGGILGQSQTCTTPYNDAPDFCEVRYRWAIEHNTDPGGPSPWPQEPQIAALPDPPPDEDDENAGETANEDEDGAPADIGDTADDTAGNTTDDDTDNTTDDDPPGGPTLEPVPDVTGWPVPGTVVAPTMQYPGVVQGIITNGSDRYEPGHVALYLEGENLPPHDGRPVQMELNEGFRQSVIAVPVGGAIRFHNGEAEDGPSYTLLSESDLAAFHHVLTPGDEVVVDFPEESRLTVRTVETSDHAMKVLVLPSTRFNLLENNSYIIRDVPPGRYMLRAVIENRRYQPLAIPIEVPAVGRATVDVTLVERGALASAGVQ